MQFEVQGEYIELCDLLKCVLGLSGGEAKVQIISGAVQVDGQVELRKKCKIRAGQRVVFDGNSIEFVG